MLFRSEEASKKQDFENAAYIRDKILAIERVSQKQKVSNISENNIDVIGIARGDIEICIEIFFVRHSKMVGREHYFFDTLNDMEDQEIISGFIKQYYIGRSELPSKIMISKEIEDSKALEEMLSKEAGRKVEIKHPQKGQKLRFVEMAQNNATVTLKNKNEEKQSILLELKETLGLEKLPRKIETFDISNISGTNIVAGMCVMQDRNYKKESIKKI